MKIAILTPTFSHFSGIDRVVEMQAGDFVKKGHEVTIFTLISSIASNGFKVVELGMPKTPFRQRIYRLFFSLMPARIREYAQMLKGYDRIISHFYPMDLIAIKAKEMYGIKYIAFNHGICFPHLFSNPLEQMYMSMFKYFSNQAIKEADEVFSVSQFLADELHRDTGVQSKVVHNRIDKKKFHPGIDGSNVRKKHHLKNEPVILFVGRLSPHKGVHLLIQAMKIVNENRSNAKLIIVGKPTFEGYYGRLKALSGRNTIFAGFIDDNELPQYYASCDVYATASLWEGFDIPVAEAQACGKPVVAFDIGSHREVVKNGKLVKEGETRKFAKAILDLIK
ncbi:MAG: glycosyl transferase group 1 [archaeon GW2011_AR3]|nr:MAG: glycosyl transferase group 1 [archaeon GW2011_AR3]MBS3109592.1 glycosyltransferase family 4 protein [Candidatus Woesearchaeota archaeon]